ncbi:aldehyde dehydrogenase family protein [Diplocarpon rosae]|nr:aldehyde dehydrogenase family protein [Diplocarpon rosae]
MISVQHYSNWVNGAYRAPTETLIDVIKPATEDILATIDSTPLEAVESIVDASLQNFSSRIRRLDLIHRPLHGGGSPALTPPRVHHARDPANWTPDPRDESPACADPPKA